MREHANTGRLAGGRTLCAGHVFGLLGGQLFRETLDQLLPVKTFEECRIPVRISVYDLGKRETQVRARG